MSSFKSTKTVLLATLMVAVMVFSAFVPMAGAAVKDNEASASDVQSTSVSSTDVASAGSALEGLDLEELMNSLFAGTSLSDKLGDIDYDSLKQIISDACEGASDLSAVLENMDWEAVISKILPTDDSISFADILSALGLSGVHVVTDEDGNVTVTVDTIPLDPKEGEQVYAKDVKLTFPTNKDAGKTHIFSVSAKEVKAGSVDISVVSFSVTKTDDKTTVVLQIQTTDGLGVSFNAAKSVDSLVYTLTVPKFSTTFGAEQLVITDFVITNAGGSVSVSVGKAVLGEADVTTSINGLLKTGVNLSKSLGDFVIGEYTFKDVKINFNNKGDDAKLTLVVAQIVETESSTVVTENVKLGLDFLADGITLALGADSLQFAVGSATVQLKGSYAGVSFEADSTSVVAGFTELSVKTEKGTVTFGVVDAEIEYASNYTKYTVILTGNFEEGMQSKLAFSHVAYTDGSKLDDLQVSVKSTVTEHPFYFEAELLISSDVKKLAVSADGDFAGTDWTLSFKDAQLVVDWSKGVDVQYTGVVSCTYTTTATEVLKDTTEQADATLTFGVSLKGEDSTVVLCVTVKDDKGNADVDVDYNILTRAFTAEKFTMEVDKFKILGSDSLILVISGDVGDDKVVKTFNVSFTVAHDTSKSLIVEYAESCWTVTAKYTDAAGVVQMITISEKNKSITYYNSKVTISGLEIDELAVSVSVKSGVPVLDAHASNLFSTGLEIDSLDLAVLPENGVLTFKALADVVKQSVDAFDTIEYNDVEFSINVKGAFSFSVGSLDKTLDNNSTLNYTQKVLENGVHEITAVNLYSEKGTISLPLTEPLYFNAYGFCDKDGKSLSEQPEFVVCEDDGVEVVYVIDKLVVFAEYNGGIYVVDKDGKITVNGVSYDVTTLEGAVLGARLLVYSTQTYVISDGKVTINGTEMTVDEAKKLTGWASEHSQTGVKYSVDKVAVHGDTLFVCISSYDKMTMDDFGISYGDEGLVLSGTFTYDMVQAYFISETDGSYSSDIWEISGAHVSMSSSECVMEYAMDMAYGENHEYVLAKITLNNSGASVPVLMYDVKKTDDDGSREIFFTVTGLKLVIGDESNTDVFSLSAEFVHAAAVVTDAKDPSVQCRYSLVMGDSDNDAFSVQYGSTGFIVKKYVTLLSSYYPFDAHYSKSADGTVTIPNGDGESVVYYVSKDAAGAYHLYSDSACTKMVTCVDCEGALISSEYFVFNDNGDLYVAAAFSVSDVDTTFVVVPGSNALVSYHVSVGKVSYSDANGVVLTSDGMEFFIMTGYDSATKSHSLSVVAEGNISLSANGAGCALDLSGFKLGASFSKGAVTVEFLTFDTISATVFLERAGVQMSANASIKSFTLNAEVDKDAITVSSFKFASMSVTMSGNVMGVDFGASAGIFGYEGSCVIPLNKTTLPTFQVNSTYTVMESAHVGAYAAEFVDKVTRHIDLTGITTDRDIVLTFSKNTGSSVEGITLTAQTESKLTIDHTQHRIIWNVVVKELTVETSDGSKISVQGLTVDTIQEQSKKGICVKADAVVFTNTDKGESGTLESVELDLYKTDSERAISLTFASMDVTGGDYKQSSGECTLKLAVANGEINVSFAIDGYVVSGEYVDEEGSYQVDSTFTGEITMNVTPASLKAGIFTVDVTTGDASLSTKDLSTGAVTKAVISAGDVTAELGGSYDLSADTKCTLEYLRFDSDDSARLDFQGPVETEIISSESAKGYFVGFCVVFTFVDGELNLEAFSADSAQLATDKVTVTVKNISDDDDFVTIAEMDVVVNGLVTAHFNGVDISILTGSFDFDADDGTFTGVSGNGSFSNLDVCFTVTGGSFRLVSLSADSVHFSAAGIVLNVQDLVAKQGSIDMSAMTVSDSKDVSVSFKDVSMASSEEGYVFSAQTFSGVSGGTAIENVVLYDDGFPVYATGLFAVSESGIKVFTSDEEQVLPADCDFAVSVVTADIYYLKDSASMPLGSVLVLPCKCMITMDDTTTVVTGSFKVESESSVVIAPITPSEKNVEIDLDGSTWTVSGSTVSSLSGVETVSVKAADGTTLKFPLSSLKLICGKGETTMDINTVKVSESEEMKKITSGYSGDDLNRLLAGYMVTVDFQGAAKTSDLGVITVTMPYDLNGQDSGKLAVYYYNGQNLELDENCTYSEDESGQGYVTFHVSHFSGYVVCEKLNTTVDNSVMIVISVAIAVFLVGMIAVGVSRFRHLA